MKSLRKIFCLTLALLMVAGILVSCGKKEASSGTTTAPQGGSTQSSSGSSSSSSSASSGSAETKKVTKDTIAIAYEAEPSNLSTTENNEIGASYVCRFIYSGLFKPTADGVVPDLCTEYHTEKDADGVESIWVFKLREGVKFSDGTDLTAQDVVDTLTFAHDQTVVKSLTGFYTKVEAEGDYTVKLYTDGVYATVPQSLADKSCFILPSELIANGHDFSNDPIGSGPYKLVKWNKGENIVLTINENYYDKDNFPQIQNIDWKIMAEGTSRTLALEAGDVDLVISVASLDIPRLEADDRFNVSITNGSMFTYVLLNATKEPFNDLNFRKFLAAAFNREDAISIALDGYATPINSCININIRGSTDENATTYDPAKAQEYLKAWGGDPSKVDFEILVTNDVRRRIAESLQNTLKEYGINCRVSNTESATLSSLARSGEYEAAVFAYTTDDFATYAKNLYYVSDSAHAGNKFRMNGDDSLNPLVDQINSTTDPATREALIKDFTSQLNAKQPVVPVYCSQTLIAYDKSLGGLSVDSRGFFRAEKLFWQ